MKRIVHFGAGRIGRSLVGQLFARGGWEVVFVDILPYLVDALNERRQYDVVIKDMLAPGEPERVAVRGVRALHAADRERVAAEIAAADLVSTAVGAANLPDVCRTIALALPRRSDPVSVMMCENLRGAAAHVRGWLAERLPAGFDIDARAGLVETVIGKMVPIMPDSVRQRDPLLIWAEAFNEIVADRAGFIGEPPEVAGLILRDNFTAHVDRKLFVSNLGHCVAAYHGFLAGKERIWQCMADQAVCAEVGSAMWASACAVAAAYPSEFSEADQRAFVDDMLRRFANRALNDSVFRVGRDLYRKLSPNDRCIGPLRLIESCGGDPEPVRRTIAAALCFKAVDESGAMFPGDERFHRELEAGGPRHMLESVCGLKGEGDAESVGVILDHYREFSRRGGGGSQ